MKHSSSAWVGDVNWRLEMSSNIAREIAEIAAVMQVKALAFDRAHPATPLGTWSAAAYADAIMALVPESEREGLARLMVEASQRAMLQLLSGAERRYTM